MEQIREHCVSHPHIYLFRVQNMRNVLFKELRTQSKQNSRFFIGKNRVMALALGLETSSEAVEGASQVAKRLKGVRGLLFSHMGIEEIQPLLEAQEAVDYARAGTVADMTVVVEHDPQGLRNMTTGELLSATLEPQLRAAGMPTKLRGGYILLAHETPYTICEAGQKLSADQARLLKAFGIKMASFRVALLGHLHQGVFEEFEDPFAADDEAVEDEQMME